MTLFRTEVVERQHRYYGDILIAMPPSLNRLVLAAAVTGLLIVLFCVIGEFSKKEKVHGILLPEGGIIDVFSPESGVITQQLVKDGDSVTKGQPLYVISTETSNLTEGGLRHRVGALLQQNVDSVQRQVSVNEALNQQKKQALEREIRQLSAKRRATEQLMAIKQRQLTLARETVNTFASEARQELISKIELRERRSQVLALEAELQELALQLKELIYQADQKRSEIDRLDSQLALEKEQLQNQITDVRQKLVSNSVMREVVVPAPIDGTISAINVYQGPVSPDTVLLSLVPKGKPLQATLFVPGRAIGFIETGQEVQLQYDAFPYQKFGQYRGVIQDISTTSVAIKDLKYQPEFKGKQKRSPFVYLVKVSLERQQVDIYGQPKPLRAGMNLEASIEVESRKIYEWLLDPFKKMQDFI
ncbi:HlyD family efflux transporter periplasmic adaptor subunit [Photobacterium sp. MCCC 1A19761]|uniref:HlyD family secretion protein n=1 Tax=Photobacterium sp. MCCC 1A19761 TaxID=3115000 RepID=UPI00307F1B3F